jgi:hypothetical protein
VTVHGKPSAVLAVTQDLEALEETIENLLGADTIWRLHASDAERGRWVSWDSEGLGRRRGLAPRFPPVTAHETPYDPQPHTTFTTGPLLGGATVLERSRARRGTTCRVVYRGQSRIDDGRGLHR